VERGRRSADTPMMIKSVGPVPVVTLIATAGVLFGFDNQPYGYYTLLRLFLCGTSVFLLLSGAKLTLPDWQRWPLGGFAILYNPVLPIRLGEKGIWEILNVTTVVLFWVVTLRTVKHVPARVAIAAKIGGRRDAAVEMTPHTLRKAATVVVIILTAFAVLHLGDRFGWLDAKAWINVSPDGDLQGVLIVGLFILMFVFADELKLTNNLDANGSAVENDERARRAGERSIVVIIAVFVVAKLLFEIIKFLSGT